MTTPTDHPVATDVLKGDVVSSSGRTTVPSDPDSFRDWAMAEMAQLAKDRLSAVGTTPLPERVVIRLETYEENGRKSAEAAAARLRKQLPLLNTLASRAAEKSIGPQERVKRLWRLADTWSEAVAPSSACKKGCSHCCHIGVAVFRSEAKAIGKAIGAAPVDLAPAHSANTEAYGYDRPCVFLKNGDCSIYAARPLACRLQFNMDVDPLLCELVPGAAIPVPYMDRRDLELRIAMSFAHEMLADIREWFPRV